MKRGYTIIELLVAMGIFSVLATLIVGAFVTVSRVKGLALTMRESQQKIRMVSEAIARSAKEANGQLLLTSNGNGGYSQVNLYYSGDSTHVPPLPPKYKKFIIDSGTITQYDCDNYDPATRNCTSGEKPQQLLSESTTQVEISDNSGFSIDNSKQTPVLKIDLTGKINGLAPYYNDTFQIINSVALENLQ